MLARWRRRSAGKEGTTDADPPWVERWVLVAPGPTDVQGRPNLYWNAEGQEWSDSPDETTEHTAEERNAVDLSMFDGDVEWWERQLS